MSAAPIATSKDKDKSQDYGIEKSRFTGIAATFTAAMLALGCDESKSKEVSGPAKAPESPAQVYNAPTTAPSLETHYLKNLNTGDERTKKLVAAIYENDSKEVLRGIDNGETLVALVFPIVSTEPRAQEVERFNVVSKHISKATRNAVNELYPNVDKLSQATTAESAVSSRQAVIQDSAYEAVKEMTGATAIEFENSCVYIVRIPKL